MAKRGKKSQNPIRRAHTDDEEIRHEMIRWRKNPQRVYTTTARGIETIPPHFLLLSEHTQRPREASKLFHCLFSFSSILRLSLLSSLPHYFYPKRIWLLFVPNPTASHTHRKATTNNSTSLSAIRNAFEFVIVCFHLH